MTAASRQRREAAGKAPDRRSLSGAFRMLSAWVTGAAVTFAVVTMVPASADQHGRPHGFRGPSHSSGASHFSAPHFSNPHTSSPHFASPRFSGQMSGRSSVAQRGYAQPYRPFRSAGPIAGSRGYAAPGYGSSYGSSAYAGGYAARGFGNEHAMLAQPGRPFAPTQSAPQGNAQNRNYNGARSQQGSVQGNGQGSGQHLGSWMNQHQNQSPAEQERALRQEQGFNRLPAQQQQNLVNRLHQLNQMPPAQRERNLQRVENFEHLSPERRQAVRSSVQQLGALPQDRKRMVQKAFRDLRDMPTEQRNAVMNSPQFSGQFSGQERSIMGNLLAVEPYQHPGPNPAQQQYGR